MSKTVMNEAEKERLNRNRSDAAFKRLLREKELQPTDFTKNISPKAHAK